MLTKIKKNCQAEPAVVHIKIGDHVAYGAQKYINARSLQAY